LAGICLIMFGRRLYWLFVGLVVLIYALLIAPQFLHGQPGWMVVAAALGSGILGAVLAVFFQRLVMGCAGFLAGGYLAFSLVSYLHLASGRIAWFAGALAGILCAVLFAVFFDWSIIILSSLVGSLLITKTLHEGLTASIIIFAALSAAGVIVQAGVIRKGP
jgi:hypothetical protein